MYRPNAPKALFLALAAFVLVLAVQSIPVYSQSVSELQSQIDQKNRDIAVLEAEIATYQKQLIQIGTEKNTLSRAIKELDLSAKKLATDIKVTENKIGAANLKLSELALDIRSTTNSITDNKAVISKLIANTRQADDMPLIEALVSKDTTLTDMWRYVDNAVTVERAIQKRVGALTVEKNDLIEHQQEVEATRTSLAEFKTDLGNQKKAVDANARDKQNLLAQTKNKESNYNALLQEKIARKAAFEAELRDYESKLKYVLDPKSLPSGRVLSWPVDKVIITQLFGKTSASGRLYASGTHNGIDFGVPLGTAVRSVGAGVVLGSGNTDLTCPGASYGNWVLIKHGNGLTSVYGHLSLVIAKTGATVTAGEVIAYSGSTGYSTGPHLHLTIFASDAVSIKQVPSKACSGNVYTQPVAATSAYLDPMLYLPKK